MISCLVLFAQNIINHNGLGKPFSNLPAEDQFTRKLIQKQVRIKV